jgi:2-keto-4-pentenoate hydratase/2-oxohepta-3-ene-1,7-dioic acid hydratase in catechol pathway
LSADPPAFGIGTFSHGGGGPYPGLVVDDAVLDLRSPLGGETTTLSLLQCWDTSLEALRELSAGDLTGCRGLGELRAHAPVASGQVLCAGANYTTHVRQIMFTALRSNLSEQRSDDELRVAAEEVLRERKESGTPYVFCAPASTLSGAYDDVVLWGPGTQHDWELELAVVIGRHASNVPVASAMGHVAGYTLSNDVSTRDVIERPGFPMTDLLLSKCRPTFFPTGPCIVPTEFIPDYRKLRITLSVNGEVMQDEGVADIIYGVEELVAYASSVVELAPGDLLLTGSPSGNAGHHENRWLRPGDVMEGSISGLGRQRNRCVPDPRAHD